MQSDPLTSDLSPAAEGLETRHEDLTDWVTRQFNPIYRRSLGGEYRWCAEWWRHAEAIVRLSALWYSWETMRLQGATGISLWFRDHLDHQLPILMGPRGPFYQCSETQHFEPHQARLTPPIEGWFDPEPPALPEEDVEEMSDLEVFTLFRQISDFPPPTGDKAEVGDDEAGDA